VARAQPERADVDDDAPLAEQAVRRSLARRQAITTDEVRRLLDAGLELMRRGGTRESPRVADIVRHAGLSNQAFYRHFASKDELVAAILDDGNRRMASYLRHLVEKETAPDRQVRRYVEGILQQAIDPDVAEATRAVHWNGRQLPQEIAQRVEPGAEALQGILHEPLARLGSDDPERDARAIAHAALGTLQEHLSRHTTPSRRDVQHLVQFCLAAVRGRVQEEA